MPHGLTAAFANDFYDGAPASGVTGNPDFYIGGGREEKKVLKCRGRYGSCAKTEGCSSGYGRQEGERAEGGSEYWSMATLFLMSVFSGSLP
jgi:hypothetical protein